MPVLSIRTPLVSAALASCMAMVACSHPPEEATPPALPTVAGAVVSFPQQKDPPALRLAPVGSSADRALQWPGRLTWNEDRTARVYAPFAGRIERLLAQVGQPVARGQALALLSSADVGQAQADLHKAEADQLLARQSAERARSLVEVGVLARKELEQAQAELQRSAAEVARSRGRLAQYGLATSGGTAGQGMAYALAAPLAGRVVERNSNPGAEVRTDVQGAALFVVSDPSTLWAQVDVDETQLSQVQPGQTLQLSVAAWPERRFAAKVLSVGESVDPATRRVKVRAEVPNAEHLLKAEMYITAEAAQREGLPLVPADAVFLRGEQQQVFVALGQGRFERRPVQVRAAGPERWAVLKGLSVGDRVVVGGALFLNQQLDTAK